MTQLQPLTAAGRHAVELAEKHAEDFATCADMHDRDGTFPYQNWEALRESRLLAVAVPIELGGLGVTSTHDFVTVFNRLARGDGSTALGSMMHAAGALLYAGMLEAGGDQAAAAEAILREMAAGEFVLCGAHSEPGSSFPWWMVEGIPVDGGWRVNGRKIFGTNSPIATHFHLFFRVPDGDGGWTTMAALVERNTPGFSVGDDWDALGMRASGSHSLTFADCFVPAEAAQVFAPWGALDPGFLIVLNIGVTGQAGVFLGIAEAARDWVIDMAKTKLKGPSLRPVAERVGIQRAVAEMDVELATCRAVIANHARFVDDLLASEPGPDDLVASFAELQCAKVVATQAAMNVVDKAMQISGGAGYLSTCPLGRMYRDVRAGPFMQAYTANEAYEVIGRHALGLDPWPDL